MKRLFFVSFIIYTGEIIAQSSETGFRFEHHYYISENSLTPTVLASMTHRFNTDHKFGIWGFMLSSKNVAKSSFGFFYKPKSSLDVLKLGLSFGFKQADIPIFSKCFIFVKEKNLSFFGSADYGGGGYWYLANMNYKLSDKFKIGARVQRFEGLGPLIQLDLKHLHIWLNPSYDFEFERYGGVIGIHTHLKTLM